MKAYPFYFIFFLILISFFVVFFYNFYSSNNSLDIVYYTQIGIQSNSVVSVYDIIPYVNRDYIDFSLMPYSKSEDSLSYKYALYYYCSKEQKYDWNFFVDLESNILSNKNFDIRDYNYLNIESFDKCVKDNYYKSYIVGISDKTPRIELNGKTIYELKELDYHINKSMLSNENIDIEIFYPKDCIMCESSSRQFVSLLSDLGANVDYTINSDIIALESLSKKYGVEMYPAYIIETDNPLFYNLSIKISENKFGIIDYNSYYVINKATSGLIKPYYYKLDSNEVKFIRFSDYFSYYDNLFEFNTFPYIVSEYIDKSRVSYSQYIYPYSGFNEGTIHIYTASICAKNSKNYVNFSKSIYKNIQMLARDYNIDKSGYEDSFDKYLSKQVLLNLAKSYDINIFDCIDSNYAKEELYYNASLGNSFFVDKIPSFFIKNQLVEGIITKKEIDLLFNS